MLKKNNATFFSFASSQIAPSSVFNVIRAAEAMVLSAVGLGEGEQDCL